MKPDLPRALQGVGMTMITRLMPEIQTPFGQQEAGLAAQLAFWASEEAERGADNHANRQVHHVALEGELLEVFEKRHPIHSLARFEYE